MTPPMEERINPGHTGLRAVLRVAGPVCLALGLLLFLSVFFSFASAIGSPDGPPNVASVFWRAPVGLVLFAIGGAMTQFGYMGVVARYAAAEGAPVAVDTVNAAAPAMAPAVQAVAAAARQGTQTGLACARCRQTNAPDARFCKGCGNPLAARTCAACGGKNDPDARFCDDCGKALA
jgi:hypothetical protein